MQKNCELNYEDIKLEIEDLHTKAFAAISAEPYFLALFKGWKVFYSPLIHKSKVLFIGINPGGGETGVQDSEHNDKGELEYLHYNYDLASETKSVFEKADKYDLLYKAVKINYYYLATSKGHELFSITDFLGRSSENDLGEKIIVNARKWTKRLIEIIEPELIICEGSESYANVTDLFIGEIKMKEDVEHVYIEEIKSNVIGYKRMYSRIKDKLNLDKTIASLTN